VAGVGRRHPRCLIVGTSRTGAELAGKLAIYSAQLPGANKAAVESVALFAKGEMIHGARAAGLRVGGTLPSASKARWGARYDLGGTTNPVARVRYVGPVHWAFTGTAPHIIGARGLDTRLGHRRRAGRTIGAALSGKKGRGNRVGSGYKVRGKGAKALSYGGRFAAYSMHPGMKGRNTWPATKKRIAVGAMRHFAKHHRSALVKVFR
jgi:hypothetical protein